jgi:hypothetical protein
MKVAQLWQKAKLFKQEAWHSGKMHFKLHRDLPCYAQKEYR